MADQNQPPLSPPAPASDDAVQYQVSDDAPLPEMPAQQPLPQTPASVHAGTPKEAADTDLIEKEWVIKAKQIVEHTKDNPYEQQKAIGKFKADYMKKRYNKDIKTSDQ